MNSLTAALLSTLLCLCSGASAQTSSELLRPLTAATYPEDTGVDVVMVASPHLATVTGEAKIRRRRGITDIRVQLNDIQPAMLFGGDLNTYVLWLISPELMTVNAGEIITQGSKGRLETSSSLTAFGLMVTAEPHFLVDKPSRFVIATSTDTGLAQQEGVGQAQIAYSEFVTSYNVRQENLAGLTEARGEARTDRHQALIAVRFAEESGAQEWAKEEFAEARAALSATQQAFAQGTKEEDLTVIAHRTVRLAVRAKRLAEERRAATMLADERKTNKETIERLQAELAESQAAAARYADEARVLRERTEKTATRLQDVEQTLLKANQDADRLAREKTVAERMAEAATNQAAGFFVRLQNALGQLAEVEEADRGLTVFLPDVLFSSGSSRLEVAAREVLSRIAGVLLVAPEYRLSIEGHTDSTGRAPLNLKLSQERAAAVREYLEDCGISRAMMSTTGFGSSQPIASNNTAAGRKQNRRVEIIIEGLKH